MSTTESNNNYYLDKLIQNRLKYRRNYKSFPDLFKDILALLPPDQHKLFYQRLSEFTKL